MFKEKKNKNDSLVYAVRTKNQEDLIDSSSGGAFTAISDYFLNGKNAVVCALYNYGSHTTEFKIITNSTERNKARGSKYMQSKPGDIYKDIKSWLITNPNSSLCFFGLGCQAEGFRKFISMSGLRERVLIVDIICHGSPSPKLWREYAIELERKNGGYISELSFKDKRNGWKNPTAKVVINNKEVLLDDYINIYYSCCALRPSCHKCPFTTIERSTDITIGDFWHIEDKIPDFYNKNGNSLLLIHTDKGKKFFEKIKDTLDFEQSNKNDCWQENLEKPTSRSRKRDKFWKDYREKGIEYIMKKYGADSFIKKVNNRILKHFVGGISR